MKEEIDHLLQLSRIKIDELEKEKLANELESILNYVKKLQEINTEDVEVMAGGSFLENIIREDEIKEEKIDIEELKNSAFKKEGDYFKIPPIFE